MATIQQRRQPLSSHHSETDPEESDWHVVAPTMSSSSSARGSGNLSRGPRNSPFSSSVLEFESDALLTTTDDDESPHLTTTSDFENISIYADSTSFAALPSHDGEGNFGAALSTDDDLEQTEIVPPRRTKSRVHLPIKTTIPQSPESDSSLPNLLLPGAGLPPPKFARAVSGPGQPLRFNLGRKAAVSSTILEPQFRPTITRTPPTPPRSSTPVPSSASQLSASQQGPSEVLGELGYLDPSSFPSTHTHPRDSRDSLDQNPMHHPTFLNTLWQHLYRIAADLIADAAMVDSTTLASQNYQQYYSQPHYPAVSLSSSGSFNESTSVIDRILQLAREARDEGFLPFGSHMLGSGFTARRGSFTDIPSATTDDWARNGAGIRRCQSEIALEWTEEGPRREKRKDRRRERERPRSVIVG